MRYVSSSIRGQPVEICSARMGSGRTIPENIVEDKALKHVKFTEDGDIRPE